MEPSVDTGWGLLLQWGLSRATQQCMHLEQQTTETRTGQINKGFDIQIQWIFFLLIIVVVRLIAPRLDETLAKCNQKMVRCIYMLLCGWVSIQFLPLLLLQQLKAAETREAALRSLYYSFEGKLHQRLQLLEGLISCLTLQLEESSIKKIIMLSAGGSHL